MVSESSLETQQITHTLDHFFMSEFTVYATM